MAILWPPVLVTAAGKVIDAFFVEFDAESRLFVLKAPKGAKWAARELETVTTEEVVAGIGGPLLLNHKAQQFERFNVGWEKPSTFKIQSQTEILRIFWSSIRASGTRQMFRLDYQLERREVVAPGVVTLPFEGDDPFIMDAGNVGSPNRVYIVYVNPAGNNAFRISNDSGATFGVETLIDDITAIDHILVECNFDDPLGARDNVQCVQVRT